MSVKETLTIQLPAKRVHVAKSINQYELLRRDCTCKCTKSCEVVDWIHYKTISSYQCGTCALEESKISTNPSIKLYLHTEEFQCVTCKKICCFAVNAKDRCNTRKMIDEKDNGRNVYNGDINKLETIGCNSFRWDWTAATQPFHLESLLNALQDHLPRVLIDLITSYTMVNVQEIEAWFNKIYITPLKISVSLYKDYCVISASGQQSQIGAWRYSGINRDNVLTLFDYNWSLFSVKDY